MRSGKSTVMSLGYRALEAHFGPTATIDADTISMMIDPRWELADEERHLDLCGYQCWLLAQSFLTAGFECVMIGSNGFHTPEEGLNDMVAFLLSVGAVYHVTLDPSIDAEIAVVVLVMRRRSRCDADEESGRSPIRGPATTTLASQDQASALSVAPEGHRLNGISRASGGLAGPTVPAGDKVLSVRRPRRRVVVHE
ncbi:MAG: hypothetical protein QOC92_445 [Acidimicrobiaceae bacterium]|jgi:hypothetical protein